MEVIFAVVVPDGAVIFRQTCCRGGGLTGNAGLAIEPVIVLLPCFFFLLRLTMSVQRGVVGSSSSCLFVGSQTRLLDLAFSECSGLCTFSRAGSEVCLLFSIVSLVSLIPSCKFVSSRQSRESPGTL